MSSGIWGLISSLFHPVFYYGREFTWMKDDVMVYSCRMDVEDDWLPSRWRFVVDLTLVELSVKNFFGWLFCIIVVVININHG